MKATGIGAMLQRVWPRKSQSAEGSKRFGVLKALTLRKLSATALPRRSTKKGKQETPASRFKGLAKDFKKSQKKYEGGRVKITFSAYHEDQTGKIGKMKELLEELSNLPQETTLEEKEAMRETKQSSEAHMNKLVNAQTEKIKP